MSQSEKEVFACFEQAFEADLKESTLTRQQFSSIMWKDRHQDAAYDVLVNKLAPKRRPDLSINEVINGLKEMGRSENCVRYLCEALGYEMPSRKAEEGPPTSEDELKKINKNIELLNESIFEHLSKKKKLQENINRVHKTEAGQFKHTINE